MNSTENRMCIVKERLNCAENRMCIVKERLNCAACVSL